MTEPESKNAVQPIDHPTEQTRGEGESVATSAPPALLLAIIGILAICFVAYCGFQSNRLESPTQAQDGWQVTSRGITRGIGGLSLFRQEPGKDTFLAVFDSKLPGEPRIAFIDLEKGKRPITRDLDWPVNNWPVDLEALTRIPGLADMYVAATSGGQLWRLRRQPDDSIRVQGITDLPAANAPQIEGLDIQRLAGKLVTVWAGRGDGPVAAALCAGVYDEAAGKTNLTDRVEFRAPWPDQPTVRHISDLRVDALGIIYVTSSMDPGNDGPYDSALYIAGRVSMSSGSPKIQLNPTSIRLRTDRGHKVEALEFVAGKAELILAADNENAGGAVLAIW